MTIATTPDADANTQPRQDEITALLDEMRQEGATLVEQANKTIEHDAAVAKGVAAMTVFENADRLGAAINEALDAAEDPDAIDLQAMKAEIVRQYPHAFTVDTPYHATPPMHQWTCEDTLIELKRGRVAREGAPDVRVLDMLRPIPSGVEATWSDFFAGAGGSSSGLGQVFGALVKIAVNHWPLAIETHNYNHPNTEHDQASLARTDPARYPRTDFAWFSPECFPAGTTILTRRGPTPIEQVQIGDEVLTHKLRWRPVTATMSKRSDTVVVSGLGHSRLETTAEHPIYVRTTNRRWDNDRRRYVRVHGKPEWVGAGDIKPVAPGSNKTPDGHMWSSPTQFGDAEPPEIPGLRKLTFDADFWWMVGRWLGDGCFRVARNEVHVTCGHHEADDLAKRLRAVEGLTWYRRDIRTATVFSTSHRHLMGWLARNFGEHAAGKTMPAWSLGMRRDWREALLDGYVSADGSQQEAAGQRPVVACGSVSRSLAVGVRMLAQSLGWKAGLTLNDRRAEGVIEGRRVKMRPMWRVQWCVDPSPKHDQTLLEDGIRWTPVRQVKAGRKDVEVFNLSVAEDESYVVDGVIVHNCTHWSMARGLACDYDDKAQQLTLAVMDEDDDTPESKEEAWRSRMLMRDVVRFARYHRYKAVIVENVPDILKWAAMDRWLAEMVAEGYRYKIITLNSAFASATGLPAPQLRDRVYVVFWLSQYKTPDFDKWLRPKGYCPGCENVVRGIYNPKPGKRRPMRYGPRAQYTYRCPNKACRGQMVQPLVLPASDAIDWSLPTQRIGDRKRPLAKKTRDRIAAGLRRYARPILAQTAGHTFERRPGVRTSPLDRPMVTQHTTASHSLAYAPGMLVPVGGARSTTVTPITDPMLTQLGRESRALVMPMEGRGPVSSIRRPDEPFRSQTARHQDALLELPEALMVPLRNNGCAEDPMTTPYRTFAAGGTHHALVMRNNTGGAEMCTPVDEPVRTLTTAGHQSLVGFDALYSYDTGLMRPLIEPMPSQTTIEGDALFGGEIGDLIDVDDCTLRMLAVAEIQRGMAFDPNYVLLGGVKRWHVRMLGNAVTPNAARDLAACVMEAITGVETPIADVPLWLPN